jgi:hypothetical protein
VKITIEDQYEFHLTKDEMVELADRYGLLRDHRLRALLLDDPEGDTWPGRPVTLTFTGQYVE